MSTPCEKQFEKNDSQASCQVITKLSAKLLNQIRTKQRTSKQLWETVCAEQ